MQLLHIFVLLYYIKNIIKKVINTILVHTSIMYDIVCITIIYYCYKGCTILSDQYRNRTVMDLNVKIGSCGSFLKQSFVWMTIRLTVLDCCESMYRMTCSVCDRVNSKSTCSGSSDSPSRVLTSNVVPVWLSGRALRQQRKRLWVRFPGNTRTNEKCITWMQL